MSLTNVITYIAGIAIVLGLFYLPFYLKLKKLRGRQYPAPIKTAKEEAGEYGEDHVALILKREFEHVLVRKFVNDGRDNEIDVILIYNSHIICIEVKNFSGRIYEAGDCWIQEKLLWGQTIRVEHTNFSRKLNYVCQLLKQHLQDAGHSSNSWIDGVICFSDECDISALKKRGYNVCNEYELIHLIHSKFSVPGSIDNSVLKDIYCLPEWDRIYVRSEKIYCKILFDRLSIETQDKKTVTVDLWDIASIRITKPMFRVKPFDVELIYADGKIKHLFTYRATVLVIAGEYRGPVSLGKLDFIEFGKVVHENAIT